MAALDLLGRRWALRILWELRGGGLTFRALRAACDEVSPTVLNTRLAELREAGVLETTPEGYALTGSGRELCAALAPLSRWSQRWARRGGGA
jgi:DNA-binding HxlR family transcriptional regulator